MTETAAIIDTETTGADEGDQIIEYFESIINLDLEVEESRGFRFEPSVPIKLGAIATHHIHADDLVGCEPSPARIDPPVQYIIGHKVDFDWRMIGKPPVRRICTLAIAQHMWPMMEKHTLTAIMYHLHDKAAREWVKGAHGAEVDCFLVLQFLKHIKKTIGIESWEELWLFSERARLPTVMSFGKHKGAPVQSVDLGYRTWYRRQPDPDPYLLRAWGYSVDIE